MVTAETIGNHEEAAEVSCESCNTFKTLVYPASHFLLVDRSEPTMLCDSCADTPEKRTVPIEMIRPIVDQRPLEPPITGSLQPVCAEPDEPGTGAHQYWMEIGHMVLETMVTWSNKVLKFTFGGNRYKGLWIQPRWDSRLVTGFTIAGTTPSKNLNLDIYQLHRLRALGFQEEGQKNKTWSIELTEPERGVPNASAAVIHILRFGYLLEPGDMYSFTPSLDIDSSDPEYRFPEN
jgi:hypothetical protein